MDTVESLVKFKWQWLLFFGVILMAWGSLIIMQPEFQQIQYINSNVIEKFVSFCRNNASDAPYITVILMWLLMSVAMMTPTAIPAIITYSNLPQATNTNFLILSFVGGFLFSWVGFSMLASTLQVLLSNLGSIDDFGRSNNLWLNAILLMGAGIYQFSSLKSACISRCRSPMAFFLENWNDHSYNGLYLGFRYGMICVGCCWALMLLAFIGGMMSLAWMTAAMFLMTAEKINDIGTYISKPIGILLIISSFIFGVLALTN